METSSLKTPFKNANKHFMMNTKFAKNFQFLARALGLACVLGSCSAASRSYTHLRTCVEKASRESVAEVCKQLDASIDGELRMIMFGFFLVFLGQVNLKVCARSVRSWLARS